jgi:hypothetical protein
MKIYNTHCCIDEAQLFCQGETILYLSEIEECVLLFTLFIGFIRTEQLRRSFLCSFSPEVCSSISYASADLLAESFDRFLSIEVARFPQKKSGLAIRFRFFGARGRVVRDAISCVRDAISFASRPPPPPGGPRGGG